MPVIPPQQALQHAYNALKNGNRRTAHHWAAYAAQSAPGLEDAWLMLAACSSPRASIAYLERALQINPSSQRARQGLYWAHKRLAAQPAPARIPSRPSQSVVTSPTYVRPFLWIGVALTLTVFSVALAFLAFGLLSTRSDSPSPVAAQIWDQSTLLRGEVLPGALPVMAASPTPELVMPTPSPENGLAFATDFPDPADVDSATPDEGLAGLHGLETSTPPSLDLVPIAGSNLPSHIVQPDEDAASIAVWYGIEVSALLSVNDLERAAQVQPGMELRIPPADYIAPPPSYSQEKLILVSISQQHLWAYEGDRLIYSFVASTGMGNSTRVGTFEVLNKIPSAYGSTWNIWMPSWMGIYWSGHLQNGIHALPILPNGAILWEGYLGTPISYGCVVLGTYEAQLLYDWAEVGTTVKIEW